MAEYYTPKEPIGSIADHEPYWGRDESGKPLTMEDYARITTGTPNYIEIEENGKTVGYF